MAIPAAYALHRAGARIDWVCGAAVEPILACYPWIRTIVADDRALLTGSTAAKIMALGEIWRQFAGRKYDLCATLYYDPRYRSIALPVRAKRKIMLSRTDRELMLLPGRHHTDEYARILLRRPDDVREQSLAPLRPAQLPPSPLAPKHAPVRVALVPAGASNMMRKQTLRRWPAESYAALARRLLERGWEVILLGGPEDQWVHPHFNGLAITDKIGQLTLPQVIAACDDCDAVVSHDTGPLHLAGLSRAAVVALFGPTNPANFMPRRAAVTGVWGGEGFACRPCYDGRDFAPCTNNACMQQITVEMALAQLDGTLARPDASCRLVLPSSALEIQL